MRLLVWILLVSSFIPLPGQAQYLYHHIGTKDGLTQGAAYFLLKDSRRFLWFLAQGSLNRYDGQNIRVYKPSEDDPQSMYGYMGSGLVESPNGDLWFGTEYGLNHYHRTTDRFSHIEAHDQQGKARKSQTHVIDADSAEVWYINTLEGIVSYNYHTRQKTIRSSSIRYSTALENDYIIRQRATADLWVLLPEGLLRYNYRSRQKRYFFTRRPDNVIGNPIAFSSIALADDGILWLTSANGLMRLEPQTLQSTFFPAPPEFGRVPVYDLVADQQKNLWLATGGSGIWVFDTRQNRWTTHLRHDRYNPNSLANDEVASLYLDPEGIIWANCDPVGIDKIIPDIYGIQQYDANPFQKNSLSDQAVFSLAEDRRGQIWIGTLQGGINVLNPKTGQIKTYRSHKQSSVGGLPSDAVNKVFCDRQGQIWVGTRNGLCRFNEKTETFTSFYNTSRPDLPGADNIRGITQLPDGRLILSTYQGLYAFTPSTATFRLLARPDQRFMGTSYLDVKTNRLYVGRWLEGLDCYQPDGQDFRLLYTVLSGANVLAYHPDTVRNRIWLATGLGLYLFNPDTQTLEKQYRERDGLPHRVIYSVLPDQEGNLWMSSNAGIGVFNPHTGAIRKVQAIETVEFNNAFLKSSTGDMYFGGNSGLYRFDPARLKPVRHSLAVTLTGLQINDSPVKPDTNLTELHRLILRPEENTISINYSAIDYFSEGANRYQYRLTGWDRAWVNNSDRTYVRYAKLPPDTYTFEVRAADAEGHWTDKPRRLTIVVEPRLWETLWFRVLAVALLLGGSFWWIYSFSRRKLRWKQQILEHTFLSQQQERQRLAQELHDHIGPDLAVLRLQMEIDQRNDRVDIQSLVQSYISSLNRIMFDLRQVSHALMPVDLKEQGLVRTLEQFVNRLSLLPNAPEINFVHDVPRPLSETTEQFLFQVAKELLNNSIKHAGASLIDVELYQENGAVQLAVADNGQGYNPEDLGVTEGIGLRSIRNSVARLNGTFTILAKPDRGMVHQITLPTYNS
ncbi:hypothetical protein GCM10023187_07270 [Nibrella viscosa]|uniref:Histidine kinase domain-containing protein n=1 Tax=Nibrella viscosa TaxID=1084524 RepID=A0ABP8JXN8_9BACT